MDTTDITPNRTGAVWVAGTGAFLLLAATALFVAVRWDELPDAAKLGVVGALTGAFLLGGRALRRTLPATGDVLFHLGALLIPVDVAAIAVRLQLGWRGLLLVEGLAAGGALTALAASSESVVLTWAAGAAPVAVAAGVAAVSPAPAPLLLVLAAAVVAVTVARGNAAVGRLTLAWATLAGLAPMLGAVAADALRVGSHAGIGVLTELGLAGRVAGWAAVGSGLLAAGVIGREAKRRRDGALAALAVGVFVAGVITAGVSVDLSGPAAWLALPGLFVAVEVAALVARRDQFWAPVVAGAALLAEIPAVMIGWTSAAWCFLLTPFTNNIEFFGERFDAEPVFGAALGLLAVGWFLMGARQQPIGDEVPLGRAVQAATGRHAWLVVPAGVAAVAQGTASGPATAAVCIGLAALLATAPRRPARLIAGALAVWAPLTTVRWQWATVVAGLAGAAVATWAARQQEEPENEAAVERAARVLLTLAAVSAALVGCALGSFDGALVTNSLLAVGACFGIAAALEPAVVLAAIARGGAAIAAVTVAWSEPERGLPALALATVLAVIDAIGRDRPVIGLGAAVTVQFVVVDLARRGGLDTDGTGLALCIAAVVWAGLALVVDQRWRLPLLAAAGAGVVAGLLLAGDDPRTHAHALLISGGLVAAGGVAIRRPAVVGGGAALVCLAIGTHLQLSDVRATDAYLAPVTAVLIGAGFHLRRSEDPPSSWVAYAPAVALLGGSALVERIAGGSGVHALVAGAVGIAAVAAGGGRRLAGPLLTGTVLLVAVTVHESLGTLASVPTWGWLAAGGSVLLAVGVALERRGASGPVEAGRRLVDVVGERFS